MLEKGKISCIQTVLLMITLVGATAVLFLPSIVAHEGGRDAWMAPLLATLPGIYLIAVLMVLARLFPGENLFQYLPKILGTWVGTIVGLLYLFFLIHTNGVIIREFTQLMGVLVLPNTPEIVLGVIMILLCMWSVRGGLEVLARTVEFFLPGVLVLFFVTMILAAPDMNIDNLFPVLDNGIAPVIRSSLNPIAWRGEIIIFAIILPYLAKPASAGRCGYAAVVAIGLILTFDAIVHTAVFGPLVETMTFSTFSLIRQVRVGDFLERIDAVLVVIWVMGMYGKIALFYYAAVLGVAQLSKAKDYRFLVMPIGVVLAASSVMVADNARELVEYIVGSFPFFAGVFEYLIPTVLLLIAFLKNKIRAVN